MTVTYTIIVTHDDDGDVQAIFKDVGCSEEDRESICYALLDLVDQLRAGTPVRTS